MIKIQVKLILKTSLISLILTLILPLPLSAQQPRSQAAKQAFKRQHPCPATGISHGACPNYIIDHIIALACGGLDDPSNMQWQTQAEAQAKDRWERKNCTPTSISTPTVAPTTPTHYQLGPRGGCYTYTASGRKRYVAHQYCQQ